MIRPAREGYRVGPLFADDAAGAEALFDGLVSRVPAGTPVFIDVPTVNASAVSMVMQRGMTSMFETARMYRGPSQALKHLHSESCPQSRCRRCSV